MRRRNFLRLGSGEAIGDGMVGCGAGTARIAQAPAPQTAQTAQANIVRGWNDVALDAIRATALEPWAAARALAILHTCMYNAWAAYDAAARQTTHGRAVRLPRAERSAASKASAMSHAAFLALCTRFPSQQAVFDDRMAGLGLDPSRPDAPLSPAGIGRTQAAAMLDACRRDSAGAPDEPIAALPFARLGPDVANLHTEEQRPTRLDAGVAEHWYRLAHQVSERDGYDDDRDVLLYFVLANALADAASAAADAGAAAAVVLRSFTGSSQAGTGNRTGVPGQELGRQVGARVFEKARRYWQGKL